MKKLIFGKDDTENIVNISITPEHTTRVYRETSEGVFVDEYDYTPYILTSTKLDNSERLKGNNFYKWLTPVRLDEDYEAIRGYGIYKPRSMEEGFMLLSGMTYFKGMKIDDVSILSFDIEATSLNPDDPNARVVMISNTLRKNGEITRKLFTARTIDEEKQMILDWCEWVRLTDPSVLIGHNIFGYDLPYLYSRAVRYNENLEIGRDGSAIRFDSKTSKKRKDGSQSYDYYNAHIDGREIIDSMFMAITYDVGRKFPSYGLKRIEEYLELVDENRPKFDFSKNSVTEACGCDDLWDQLCDYGIEDADSPIKMFDIMGPSFFYLNQSIPKTFQQMINEATGSQIDSFMVRAYLQDGYSQPKSSPKNEFQGAISMGVPGIYNWVRKVDVASLYPSIMRQYRIYPRTKDPQKYFLKALNYFTEERLKNKELAKTDKYYDDLQGAQKILINSKYGFMGASYLLYNDPREADKVTKHGREILQTAVEWACGYQLRQEIKHIKNKGKDNEERQYEWVGSESKTDNILVNVDTDSISYTNGRKPEPGEFEAQIEELNKLYPDLIKWEDDGVFEKVIVVKAKNYVLKKDGKVKYKGSSLTDQKKEPALIEFLHEVIGALLEDRKDDIVNIYNKYCLEAYNVKNLDISRWVTKKTVTKSVLDPKRTNEQKVLDALEGFPVQEGDKVWLYTAIDPNDQEKTILKLSERYSGDADRWHYVKRVYNTIKILENILEMKQFEKYHNKGKRAKLEEMACNPDQDVVNW
jgi:DNA polymerase elongation subunit (family B)